MEAWQWLRLDVAQALHAEQLTEHGGAAGVRDARLLQSALDRPRRVAAEGEADAAALAAAYIFGFARIRPFVSGNRRTAALATLVFLAMNRVRCSIGQADLAVLVEALVAGDLAEAEAAHWFRARFH